MAKPKERQIARFYYVDKLSTAAEAAKEAGVAEKTLSQWVTKYGWKAEREARASSQNNRTENLKETISLASQERIALSASLATAIETGDIKEVAEIRQQIARVDAGVANWNKTLSNLDKEYKITLNIYLEVMDQVFDALRAYDMVLFLKTTDFQEQHIHSVSARLG